MEKKGLMTKFLVTVILALIIFVPACSFASKFFRLSTQAKNNFADFVDEIEDLAENGDVGEERSFMLIMDDKTSIYFFNINNVRDGRGICMKKTGGDGSTFPFYVNYPAEQCANQSCVCLCQDEVFLSATETNGNHEEKICNKLSCIPLNKTLLTLLEREEGFRYRTDFIFSRRKLVYSQIWEPNVFTQRRSTINLKKMDLPDGREFVYVGATEAPKPRFYRVTKKSVSVCK